MKFTLTSILLPLALTSMASAALIVDFTAAGGNGNVNNGGFVFQSQDPSGTGVSFTITASAVIPAGGGANGGDIFRQNGGLGSTVENTGGFLNVFDANGNAGSPANPGVSEVLQFTISNVMGLAPGQQLGLSSLLSQNANSTAADQSGGFGGAFGQQAVDSVTLTSDLGTSIVINQSDDGDQGAILLNSNNNNNGNTGNTFAHAGALDFNASFDLALTDLNANNAVTIQGFEFVVIPEPSTSFLALGSLGLLLIRKRRA